MNFLLKNSAMEEESSQKLRDLMGDENYVGISDVDVPDR